MTPIGSATDIRLHDTVTLFNKGTLTGAADPLRFNCITGSRIVWSLLVVSIDPGATAKLEIKNDFSNDGDFPIALSLELDTTGRISKVLTDFHKLFDIRISVTGGSAEIMAGCTVRDNSLLSAMADALGRYDSVRLGDGENELDINPDGSINTKFTPSEPADPIFIENRTDITPGSEQELISSVVPTGKKRYLKNAYVICRRDGSFVIKKNSTIIGSGRTGAANPMANFAFSPARPIAAGDTIKILFTGKPGPVASVEGYVQGFDEPI
jgi:hypothetical protein